MRIQIKILPFFGLIYLATLQASGQSTTLQWEKSIPITQPSAISKDRNGFIYCANDLGDVIKYDHAGNIINTYSPDKPGVITLIEAWPALRTLVFYADFQEYLFLDRFLNASPNYQVSRENIGFSVLLTLSEDNNLWLVDNESLNLIKFDNTTDQILINASLNNYILEANNRLNFIKAYQQQVFINDANAGILVFDNLGNFMKKLPVKGLGYFNFLKDELYYLSDNTINFIHLYNLQERSVTIRSDKDYQNVLLVKDKAFLIGPRAIDIYRVYR
ncbi:hypothetical protein QQ020_10030 [Fulvivirgaceae bacterium BMA12]|uniref:Uncharacterized protein n=1 Tax=Agaribacillus aureus TaxID=3051825 RepID=A0ABT8L551_9BACT|nr:hypothetical protein [Fulvivirgaceae bacterium BMA12]